MYGNVWSLAPRADRGSGKLEQFYVWQCMEPCSQGCHLIIYVVCGKQKLVVCMAMYGALSPGLSFIHRVGSESGKLDMGFGKQEYA